MEKEIKLVFVGDGSVGKTCVLVSYTTDKFPTDYVPTIFENYSGFITVNGQQVKLNLIDTAGQETYNQLRTLSYGMADCFVVVFSVVEQASFRNVTTTWIPELSKGNLANVPKVIVGNKIDMRDDSNPDHIQKEVAKQVLAQQGVIYLECSALTQEGLKDVFDESVRQVLAKQNKQISPDKKKPTQKKACCEVF